MQLLTPSALWLLAVSAPLVLLYILKIRRQRRPIASTWLWQQARRDLMARTPFKRLIWQLPLFLQLLALVALALSATGPAKRSRAVTGDHLAIIVDTSASMAAAESGGTRMALAKATAHELVDSLAPGSDAMILEAGREARVVLSPDRDVRRMHAAIDNIAARDVEGDLGQAIALAASRLKQLSGERRIVVISDGNLAKPAPLTGLPIPLELVRVGDHLVGINTGHPNGIAAEAIAAGAIPELAG